MTVAQADSSALESLAAEPQLQRKPRTYWSMALQTLRRDLITLVAIGFLALMAVISSLASVISNSIGVGPNDTNPDNPIWAPISSGAPVRTRFKPRLCWANPMASPTGSEPIS